MRNFALFIGALIAALALLPGFAQTHANESQTQFKTATRVVTLNVVVTDRDGDPARGLSRGDFTLIDDGKVQSVAFFDATPNGPISEGPLPRGDYTNRQQGQGESAGATALVFDTLNSRWSSQGYGLQRVRNFLRQISPEDHLGVYVLSENLMVVHDIDHDASDIVGALRRYDDTHSSDAKPRVGSTGLSELDRFLSGRNNRFRPELEKSVTDRLEGQSLSGRSYRDAKLEEALEDSLAWLQDIARHLQATRGRKTLIWISDAIPGVFLRKNAVNDVLQSDVRGQSSISRSAEPSSGLSAVEEKLERLIRLLNQADIAIYPVSAEGLQAMDLGFREQNAGYGEGLNASAAAAQPGGSHSRSHGGGGPTPAYRADQVMVRLDDAGNSDNHNFMEELARRTGGRAYYNRNDLETGIRRALDDSRYTYELAYYPDHNDWKGEWRNIQVKVNKPGLKVLARGGYFAFPDPRPLPPKAREQFLSEIAASPLEATELPFTMRVSASPNQLEASVHLNPQPMLMNQGHGQWKGSFELVFFQLDNRSEILDVTTKTVELDLKPETYQQRIEKGLDIPAKLAYKAGATLLCVVLHDRSSDTVGSIRIPLARYAAALHLPPTLH